MPALGTYVPRRKNTCCPHVKASACKAPFSCSACSSVCTPNASEIGAQCSLHRAPDGSGTWCPPPSAVDGIRDPRRCLTRRSVGGRCRGGAPDRRPAVRSDPPPLVPIVSADRRRASIGSAPRSRLVGECARASVVRGGCRTLAGGPPADRDLRGPADGPPDLVPSDRRCCVTRPSMSALRFGDGSWTDGSSRRAPSVDVTLAPSRFAARSTVGTLARHFWLDRETPSRHRGLWKPASRQTLRQTLRQTSRRLVIGRRDASCCRTWTPRSRRCCAAELPLQNVTVSFATPDDQFPPTSVVLPAIVLFLYDVRENYELRTDQWELDRQPGGVATRRRAPSDRLLVPDHGLGQRHGA